MVTVTVGEPTHAVSDRLYGVFFEDINLGTDGGLNANMVNNYSFDGVYLDHHSLRVQGSQRWRAQSDPLRFWQFEGVSAVSCGTQRPDEHGRPVSTDCPAPPVHPHSRYARLSVHGGHGIEPAPARVENLGYNGGGANAHACAMSIARGHGYEFSMVLRPVAGGCDIRVSVVDRYGLPLTDAATFRCDVSASAATVSARDPQASVRREADDWHLLTASLQGRGTEYGKLRIDLIRRDGEPVVCDMDCVTLMDAEYRWKDTVGALPARRQQYSMWGFRTPDGSSYAQSYQIGFYEYFCLCEDLNAKPLPTLFAGITCQSPYRDPRHIDIDSPYFRDVVVQDYLDLIDFANGDPETSRWARIRADMGHPEPFGLDMIGIGNENYGADYVAKYDAIARAIHAKDPSMLCVMSAGLFPFALPMRRSWEHARSVARVAAAIGGAAGAGDSASGRTDGDTGVENKPETIVAAVGSATGDAIIVDEHSYHSPDWFIAQAHRFDDYPRCGAGVCFGEYSANGYFAGQPQRYATACQWRSALAEAAFLTGCERNSDVVRMTSYAPLLAHIPGKGWEQNLIEFNPAHINPTVNYEVQRLFSANVGSLAYACSVSPEAPKRLFVSATGDQGSRRYIKLVNVGDESVQVTLDVSSGLRALGGLRRRTPTMRVETLHGRPQDKRSLEYMGPARGDVRHEVSEYRLSSTQVHVAIAVKPYSVTLVTVE